MVDGKVKLGNFDAFTNVANALTKLVSTKKFKWCYNFIDLGSLSR